jgi:hypothetical protein
MDALTLPGAPVESIPPVGPATKVYAETAVGRIQPRHHGHSKTLRRVSLDLHHAGKLAPEWRYVVSDRVDHQNPAPLPGIDDTLNSLREAYVGWEPEGARVSIDAGRINWRNGPAYGFNPTDFFRDHALRSVTTLNPFALRENRLGVGMLRLQHLWQDGAFSVALAPKLADAPSGEGESLDFGATNNRNRLLLTATQQFSERFSGQVLLYKEQGLDVQPGASFTVLIGNATVGHSEWSYGRDHSLADRSGVSREPLRGAHRFAGGFTYTTARKLSFTAELQYNGFALDEAGWRGVAARGGPALLGAYLLEAERRQDLAVRRVVMLYVKQQSFGSKNLDLTGFVRVNTDDHSRLGWVELRHRWESVDLAVQWQHYSGKSVSQFGFSPERQVVQLVATYHFK